MMSLVRTLPSEPYWTMVLEPDLPVESALLPY